MKPQITYYTQTSEGPIPHRRFKSTEYPYSTARLCVKLDTTKPVLINGTKYFPPARTEEGLLIWALPGGGETSFKTGQN